MLWSRDNLYIDQNILSTEVSVKYKLLDLSTRARESLVPWITERDFVAVLYPEM